MPLNTKGNRGTRPDHFPYGYYGILQWTFGYRLAVGLDDMNGEILGVLVQHLPCNQRLLRLI